MMVWAIIAVVIVILIIMVINIYNNYVKLDLENHEAFSNIGVFLQKKNRFDPKFSKYCKRIY